MRAASSSQPTGLGAILIGEPGITTGQEVTTWRRPAGSRDVSEDLGPYTDRRPGWTMVSMAGGKHDQAATTNFGGQPHLPPRWFVIGFWHAHRALLRVTRGRLGLWRPRQNRWGALWLTTVGRRTGRRRQVVLGYVEDGQNLVTMAMNGWGAGEPAWWLNLQGHPDTTLRTRDGLRHVRAHRAQGAERARLWAQWAAIDKNLDAYAALRPAETAVVVFEPAGSAGSTTDR